VEEFKSIFEGLDRAYGQHRSAGKRADGKQEGKSYIEKKLITDELWKAHLAGKGPSLGIIPIRADNTSKWGCIDIDNYPIDYNKIISSIRKLKLPIVPCRSKSGGLHLFIFFDKPIAAKLVREKLKEISASIGYANAELFPKQSSILLEKGDLGNFLNLPYYNAKETARYAYKDDGTAATLQEFINLYKHYVVSDLSKILIEVSQEVIKDGPPCLQQLCTQGFPEGTRNNGLFNIGVYLRKFDPDNWKSLLEEHNRDYMNPPLGAQEVVIVQKQLEKKSYNYRCKEPPINAYCNAKLCRTRKHGIGGGNGPLEITGLSKLKTDPPVWFLQVGDTRLELQTEELQNQQKFQRICMNVLNTMPPFEKQSSWTDKIDALMQSKDMVEIDASDDGSVSGQFETFLQEFCTGRAQALTRDDLKFHKPWTEKGKTYFRLNDLMDFLARHKFTDYNIGQVITRLRDVQTKSLKEGEKLEDSERSHRWNIKKNFIRVWWVPAYQHSDSKHEVKGEKDDDIPF
jgi:hypothetical protein